jgi:hypothetical protein
MSEEPTGLLAILPSTDIVGAFNRPGGIETILGRIEEEALAHAPDTSTVKGREAIKSLAYKVSRSKTALDEAGKSLTEEKRKAIAVVDEERRNIRLRLDSLRDKVRKPLTDWEDREEARVSSHRTTIKAMRSIVTQALASDSESIEKAIFELEEVDVSPAALDEFWEEGKSAKALGLEQLKAALPLAQQREAEAAELARLRVEKAQRDAEEAERQRLAAEQERQRRIEEEARANAERNAELARKAQEEERQRQMQAERDEADRRVKAAEDAARKAESEAQLLRAEEERRKAWEQEERRKLLEAQRQAEQRADEERRKAVEAAKLAGAAREEVKAWLMSYFNAAVSVDLAADQIIGQKVPHLIFQVGANK